ncbi:hypothetical protein [Companilactobacillus sp.]|jgi:hypothetical protein|uniref:hypothetical protein n=1 Tax=Companilactobacillus sp. TaxID=2767905 RepID=UPI0025C2C55C|nr:hypothetical protein [Companilactobacillus sp.]MCH4008283.1 hypothetical protein [Companilactobacillus sp.]MCH4051538.1 hypothetical protein [Companilactobacillus sp.]MCH4076226.1 hypothetical protein [Companilactobacillus sp.]MCH4124801.1 hypothetical protein [Companilactobacillus sp.]MCH4131343.1 hypothetical protein [Companilactobacillus sp.]
MFKKALLKSIAVSVGLVSLSIVSLAPQAQAAVDQNEAETTNQLFPTDYLNNFLDGVQTNVTLSSYDLADNVDGYYRTYDQFMNGDMAKWLGAQNVAYAKSVRNSSLVNSFMYRVSPSDDDYNTFYNTTVPNLKKDGGTAELKLQVLNSDNYSQVLKELPITITVPAPEQLNVDYSSTTTYTNNATKNIFTSTYQLPSFTITDSATGKSYKATNITPVNNVYIDGKKTALTDLPNNLTAGTYTQSIYFTVAGFNATQLKQLAANSKITGNNGDSTIRYSNGQLIAARTIIVK